MKFIYTDFYRYFDEYKIQSVRCLNLLHLLLYKSGNVCYIMQRIYLIVKRIENSSINSNNM